MGREVSGRTSSMLGGAGRSGGAGPWGAASLRAPCSGVIRFHVVVCAVAGSAIRTKPRATVSAADLVHESVMMPFWRELGGRGALRAVSRATYLKVSAACPAKSEAG